MTTEKEVNNQTTAGTGRSLSPEDAVRRLIITTSFRGIASSVNGVVVALTEVVDGHYDAIDPDLLSEVERVAIGDLADALGYAVDAAKIVFLLFDGVADSYTEGSATPVSIVPGESDDERSPFDDADEDAPTNSDNQ